jgi:hypothetical protein
METEGDMIEEPRKVLIRLNLTPRQQRQIREASGREINTLALRLVPLPRPAETVDGEQSTRGSDTGPDAGLTRRQP